LPVPVFLKRLAAPLWVFNLGIFLLWLGWAWWLDPKTSKHRDFPTLLRLCPVYPKVGSGATVQLSPRRAQSKRYRRAFSICSCLESKRQPLP
jgi:hypothetical protein